MISGEEEGRLIYMGVASTVEPENERRLVVDIGGGSTELILGHGVEIRHVESFSIGTVKQGLIFFPNGQIDPASFDAAVLSARSHFEDASTPYQPELWSNAYGSSGTLRAIADVIARNSIGDGTMSYKSLQALKTYLTGIGNVSRFDLPGIKAERVIIMVGGLTILIGLMQALGIKTLAPVNAGLRMGVLWDLQLRTTTQDRREQSVLQFMERFHADADRATRVAAAALALYRQLKPETERYIKYLYWSSLLHETGLAISHTGFHKHAAYMVEHADLPGFTTREQKIMSSLIVAQKGNLRKVGESLAEPDFAKAVFALRLATMFMHSRIDGDIAEIGAKMKSRIELEFSRDWIAQHPTVSYWIEKEMEWWREIGIEMTVRKVG